MKGYVVSYKDKGFQYRPGKTYIFEGDFVGCQGINVTGRQIIDLVGHQGIEVFLDLRSIFLKYDEDKINILEAEIPSDAKTTMTSHTEPSLMTNKINVLRILSKKDIEEITDGDIKFDPDVGKLAFIRFTDINWTKYKYDEKGNIIELSTNHETKYYKYDNKGRVTLVLTKTPKGKNTLETRYWYEYKGDEKNGYAVIRSSYGNWRKIIFKNGLDVLCKNRNGVMWSQAFNPKKNIIYKKEFSFIKQKTIIKNLKNGIRIVFYKKENGQWGLRVFDRYNRCIYFKVKTDSGIYWEGRRFRETEISYKNSKGNQWKIVEIG